VSNGRRSIDPAAGCRYSHEIARLQWLVVGFCWRYCQGISLPPDKHLLSAERALLAISLSLAPASAASKICARLSLRAACLPPLRSAVIESHHAAGVH
jgi:hypothetical protein